MNPFLTQAMWLFNSYQAIETEMSIEFKRRADEAYKKYWDACKYPRKKKKHIRKEAKEEYNFANMCAQPMF